MPFDTLEAPLGPVEDGGVGKAKSERSPLSDEKGGAVVYGYTELVRSGEELVEGGGALGVDGPLEGEELEGLGEPGAIEGVLVGGAVGLQGRGGGVEGAAGLRLAALHGAGVQRASLLRGRDLFAEVLDANTTGGGQEFGGASACGGALGGAGADQAGVQRDER